METQSARRTHRGLDYSITHAKTARNQKFYDNSGENAKILMAEAEKLARRAKAEMKVAETFPDAGEKARKLKSQADNLNAEANTLKEAARLEDLSVWVMGKVKPTKKGKRSYHHWMAT